MKKLMTLFAFVLVAFTANAQSTLKGDVNGDGEVNVTDVTMIVEHVLGQHNSSFIVANADVNGDGDITVTDVAEAVNIILDGNQENPAIQLSTTKLSLSSGIDGYCSSKQATIEILSGSGNYSIVSSNPAVATAEIVNNAANQTHKSNMVRANKGKTHTVIIVYAEGEGKAKLTLTDNSNNNTSTIQVTVGPYYLKCPDSNHPHIIDLGLPSGTLWACCNVGATKPEGYGGFYAWGETEEKDFYSLSNWPFNYQDPSDLSWYLNSLWPVDDITGTQYDVAHVKWGENWVMPSIDQFGELAYDCVQSWVSVNDVQGVKIRRNEASVFFPAAGYKEGRHFYQVQGPSYVDDDVVEGYYWSSSHGTRYPEIPDDPDPLEIYDNGPLPELEIFHVCFYTLDDGMEVWSHPHWCLDDGAWTWQARGIPVRPVWVP